MSMLLRVVGGIWAVLGVGNLIGMFSTPGLGTGIGTFGLIFNMVLFVIPGLGLLAIGHRMNRKADPAARIRALDQMLAHEHITADEHARRKAEILREI